MRKINIKILSLLLSFLMLSLSINFTVFANVVSSQDIITLTTVTLGNETIVVPMKTKKLRTRSAQQGEEVTFYIPSSQEKFQYNQEYVNKVRNRLTATDEFPDPRNYITFTSHIYYTNTNSFVLITGTHLSKNKPADSYLKGIGSPSVRIVCIGVTMDSSWDTMNQEMTVSQVGWGETVNTPSTWRPVLTNSDLYRSFAQYEVDLLYGENFETVHCNFTHTLSK